MPFDVYVDPRQPEDPFRFICVELGRMRGRLYCLEHRPEGTDPEALRASLRERCLGELSTLCKQIVNLEEKTDLYCRIALFAHELGADGEWEIDKLFHEAHANIRDHPAHAPTLLLCRARIILHNSRP